MQLSTDRILTTQAGSLPRPPALSALLALDEAGKPVDREELTSTIGRSMLDVIRRQHDAGIDIASDGEHSRVSYLTYVPRRMRGFGGESKRPIPRDMVDFPEFGELYQRERLVQTSAFRAPMAIGEIHYDDCSAVNDECTAFGRALTAADASFANTFVTAASPGVIACCMLNGFYDTHEQYVFAIAREMKKEYDAIHAAGHVLQLDCPDLAGERAKLFWSGSDADFLKVVELHVEAINAAIADIPRDRVRMHVCWGNYAGPHVHDFPLEPLLPLLYRAKIGALSIEFANPRHQHEYAALKKAPLPDAMALIPGVIDTTTNFVEHDEVIAARIVAAVDAVGSRERVIAGTDCGFDTYPGLNNVLPSIVWAKLSALARGAELASKRLWGRTSRGAF
jgi:5-methyltetrahydropteroyltriglutamate--homocysteine methyltransferase